MWTGTVFQFDCRSCKRLKIHAKSQSQPGEDHTFLISLIEFFSFNFVSLVLPQKPENLALLDNIYNFRRDINISGRIHQGRYSHSLDYEYFTK